VTDEAGGRIILDVADGAGFGGGLRAGLSIGGRVRGDDPCEDCEISISKGNEEVEEVQNAILTQLGPSVFGPSFPNPLETIIDRGSEEYLLCFLLFSSLVVSQVFSLMYATPIMVTSDRSAT
jgi:hypothetical protein